MISNEDAITVAKIMNNADGECIVCAASLNKDLQKAFPERADVIRNVYVREFGESSYIQTVPPPHSDRNEAHK